MEEIEKWALEHKEFTSCILTLIFAIGVFLIGIGIIIN